MKSIIFWDVTACNPVEPPKRRLISTGLHGVESLKIVLFTVDVVRYFGRETMFHTHINQHVEL
jgi:hypothetical protein